MTRIVVHGVGRSSPWDYDAILTNAVPKGDIMLREHLVRGIRKSRETRAWLGSTCSTMPTYIQFEALGASFILSARSKVNWIESMRRAKQTYLTFRSIRPIARCRSGQPSRRRLMG